MRVRGISRIIAEIVNSLRFEIAQVTSVLSSGGSSMCGPAHTVKALEAIGRTVQCSFVFCQHLLGPFQLQKHVAQQFPSGKYFTSSFSLFRSSYRR